MGPEIADWKRGERFEIFGEVFEVVRILKSSRSLDAQTVHRDKVNGRDFLMGGKTFHIRDLSIAKPFDKDRWERMHGKSLEFEKPTDRLAQLKAEAGVLTVPAEPKQQKCFFRALVKSAVRGYDSLAVVEKAAISEASGSQGGYTVPPEYSNVLFESIAEHSIFWPRARVITCGSLELNLSVPDFTTAQAANTTAMFGGLLFKFGTTGSPAAPDETEPTFRQVVLRPWSLIGNAVASIQYVDDLLARDDGEMQLLRLFGEAAAWYADWNFFNGTGAGRQLPLGVLNAPCKILVNRASGSHIAQADLANMTARLLPRSWPTAIWCVSPGALVDLFKITGWQPNEYIENRPGGSLGYMHGLPVFPTEKLPALGVAGDVVLLDPDLYLIGDRQQPEVSASREEATVFQKNQMMFRTWMRVDGKPLLDNVVTLADGSSTASSVVVLN